MEKMTKIEAKESMRGFAKLTLDFSFKRVFGNGTNNEALISFLNRMIGDVEIEKVELLPTERLGLVLSDRKVVFDIYCRDKNGTEFIVEMQCAKQTYFKDRALYYAGHPLVEQGRHALEHFIRMHDNVSDEKSDIQSKFRWNYNLKPIIVIGILNFSMSHDAGWPEDQYYSSYTLQEKTTHEPMSDKLRFIFLELGRFNKGLEELETIIDKWMYAFKHMHEFRERPQNFNEKEFDVLFNLAKIANFTESDITSYMDEMIRDNDYWNCLEYAKAEAISEGRAAGMAEGRAAGMAEGRAAGMAEGIAEGRAESIRKMHAAGFSSEQICSILEISNDIVLDALK